MKIEEIKKRKIAVHCNTQEKANRILREIEKLLQKKEQYPDLWFFEREETCHGITKGKTMEIMFGNASDYEKQGYEIVEFEDIEDIGEFKTELKEVKPTTQEILEQNAVKIQEALAIRIQEQCTGPNEDNVGIAELTEAWIKIRNII